MTSPATTAALHPGIVTSRLAATCAFYVEVLGFSTLEATDDFALLGRDDGSRLAVLQAGGEGQPAALHQPTRGAGVWLTLPCDDVDAMHARLVAHGVEIVAEPEFTAGGDHRCVARDPNGVLLYVTRRRVASDPRSFRSFIHQKHHHEVHGHCLHRLSCH